jgi:hypothetical protein
MDAFGMLWSSTNSNLQGERLRMPEKYWVEPVMPVSGMRNPVVHNELALLEQELLDEMHQDL